jgi:predicted SnoaL-like aldol condensation-catalyzing enzyme
MRSLSVDMVRFDEEGKLAEHWVVQQNVDPKVEDYRVDRNFVDRISFERKMYSDC